MVSGDILRPTPIDRPIESVFLATVGAVTMTYTVASINDGFRRPKIISKFKRRPDFFRSAFY